MLARQGARVAINDLAGSASLPRAIEILRAEGLDVLPAPGDVSSAEDVVRMVAEAASAMGGLDYLVNNAATPGTRLEIPPSDLDSQDDAFWTQLLSVNLIGPFRCARAALPHLRAAQGAIVNVVSTAALGGGGSSTAYASSKAGLVLMTRELAKGLGPDIRVNAVAPGWVGGTEWMCGWSEEEAAASAKRLPLGRVGQPDDFAEVILFLCAAGAYMTGQTVVVDGGLLA
jgi:3-oxoacyl-[acyl-carrier protein] reductase